jgi:hypothetical protein
MKIIVCCGFALALLGTLAVEVAAQTSCSGWESTCRSRGGTTYCNDQMSICKRTGCWTEVKRVGGAKHCGLKKS